jgi:hypothetical protein
MKLLREYIRQILNEERKPSFRYEGSPSYFRVSMNGIGYAQGGRGAPLGQRFDLCQDDVDALKLTPEYLAAEEKWIENNPPGPYSGFTPQSYGVDNAWIDIPENRGKGHGREIYEAWIKKAIEYSKGYGGVFIAGAHCYQTANATSPDAKRVWKSLVRDYPTSSGLVIFIGL